MTVKQLRGNIVFPSGFVGYKERVLDAAKRELLEETGYSFTNLQTTDLKYEFNHKRLVFAPRVSQQILLCNATIENTKRVKAENGTNQIMWMTQKEVNKSITYPELAKVFNLILNRKIY